MPQWTKYLLESMGTELELRCPDIVAGYPAALGRQRKGIPGLSTNGKLSVQ